MYVTSKVSPSEMPRQKYVIKHNYEERYNHLKVSHVDSNDRDMQISGGYQPLKH